MLSRSEDDGDDLGSETGSCSCFRGHYSADLAKDNLEGDVNPFLSYSGSPNRNLVNILSNYSEILSAIWSWKDLCIQRKMVPPGIYDVIYHPYNFWNF